MIRDSVTGNSVKDCSCLYVKVNDIDSWSGEDGRELLQQLNPKNRIRREICNLISSFMNWEQLTKVVECLSMMTEAQVHEDMKMETMNKFKYS